jgi:hypothetical protein
MEAVDYKLNRILTILGEMQRDDASSDESTDGEDPDPTITVVVKADDGGNGTFKVIALSTSDEIFIYMDDLASITEEAERLFTEKWSNIPLEDISRVPSVHFSMSNYKVSVTFAPTILRG